MINHNPDATGWVVEMEFEWDGMEMEAEWGGRAGSGKVELGWS